METRIWISFGKITKTEPLDTDLTLDMLKVKASDPSTPAIFDGVWVRGNRTYDTYVIIEGVVAYHSPRADIANISFDEHERQGGGCSLN